MARITSSSSTGTVSIQDSAGNSISSTDGALNVNITSAPANNIVLIENFNEITNIASGIESLIVFYTNRGSKNSYLQRIEASGTNISEYRLYRDTDIINKKYSGFTQYNIMFDYRTGNSSAPGLNIAPGETIYLKAIQNRPSVANFNGNLIVIEVI